MLNFRKIDDKTLSRGQRMLNAVLSNGEVNKINSIQPCSTNNDDDDNDDYMSTNTSPAPSLTELQVRNNLLRLFFMGEIFKFVLT